MRTSAILAAAIALTVAAPALAEAKTVRVDDNYFVRPAGVPLVKIARGSRVTWRWRGSAPHNVVATCQARLKTGPLSTVESWSTCERADRVAPVEN